MSKRGFKGISFPFRFDGRGGVAKSSTDFDDCTHIEESIKQILATARGERIHEVGFGSEVRKSQFKNLTDPTEISELQFYVQDALNKWENRVKVNDINITPFYEGDMSGVYVDISLTVIKYLQDFTITTKLNAQGEILDA